MRAPFNDSKPPYQFKPVRGGHFVLGSQYGSISCKEFSLFGIIINEDKEGDGETSDDESSDEENESISITEDSEADDDNTESESKSGPQVCTYESNK